MTKLSYLLSKPDLTPTDVRNLIGTPLRGELTGPSKPLVAPLNHHHHHGQGDDRNSTLEHEIENIQSVLSHLVRLSASSSNRTAAHATNASVAPPTATVPFDGQPKIVIEAQGNVGSSGSISSKLDEAAAAWSWTAAEAVTTEIALFSSLIHLSAASDDIDGLELCLSSGDLSHPSLGSSTIDEGSTVASTGGLGMGGSGMTPNMAGGIVNWVNPASGRSPLHVAALNGSRRCVEKLLEAGALVHLRDSLGHTALYYVGSFFSVLLLFCFSFVH